MDDDNASDQESKMKKDENSTNETHTVWCNDVLVRLFNAAQNSCMLVDNEARWDATHDDNTEKAKDHVE